MPAELTPGLFLELPEAAAFLIRVHRFPQRQRLHGMRRGADSHIRLPPWQMLEGLSDIFAGHLALAQRDWFLQQRRKYLIQVPAELLQLLLFWWYESAVRADKGVGDCSADFCCW